MAVYVVQQQTKWDDKTQSYVPKFNLEAASMYGGTVFLLGPGAKPFAPKEILPELHKKLSTFDNEDCLLLIGNPILIGMAVAIAADYNEGFVAVLQWSGASQSYIKVEIEDIFPNHPSEKENNDG